MLLVKRYYSLDYENDVLKFSHIVRSNNGQIKIHEITNHEFKLANQISRFFQFYSLSSINGDFRFKSCSIISSSILHRVDTSIAVTVDAFFRGS